jgi:hypothetical protein
MAVILRSMRDSRRLIALGCLAGSLMSSGLTGCADPLFPKDTPRNQFETYDRMRNRYVPLEEPDEFGNPQPALRARLSQPR